MKAAEYGMTIIIILTPLWAYIALRMGMISPGLQAIISIAGCIFSCALGATWKDRLSAQINESSKENSGD